ncbi:helix-turn-helix domain-containing protein [Salibacterium sp. K-3]
MGMIVMASIEDRLKQLRKQHKLTQKEVASYLDMTESGYGYYEQGRNEPSLGVLKSLAKKYDVTVSYLLGETDIPNPPDEEYDPMEDLKQFFIDNDLQDAGFNFYDINEWKKMSREQIQEVKNHWLWVKEKARRMEEEDDGEDDDLDFNK